MTITAPSLYIGGHLMRGDAADIRPVLAGLQLSWGTDSTIEFEDPAGLSFDVLLRPGAGFVSTVGTEVALMDGARTLFAGRISNLASAKHESKKDSQRLRVTCADTLADLVALRAERIHWGQTDNSGGRIQQIRNVLAPFGWEITGEGRHAWTPTNQQRWIGKNVLPLIDMHARGTLARRLTTSTYTPGVGMRRRITFVHERLNVTPGSSTPIIRIPASNLKRDLEWKKNAEDLITDVQITRHWLSFLPANDDEESSNSDVWTEWFKDADTSALKRAYGIRTLSLDIDVQTGTTVPQAGYENANPLVGYITQQWANGDVSWRPTEMEIADSRLLSDASVYDLLDVTRRGRSYVVLTDLPEGNPSGHRRVEAYVTGGSATWTGKRWDIKLTLGRQTAASNPF